MSRSFPILVASMLVTGAIGANAHPSTRSNPTSSPLQPSLVSAFAGSAAAQSDDIAAKVKAALKAEPELDAASEALTITAAGGVVTLEGTVPSVQIRARIGESALKVDGVTKLVNKLKLPKK